MNKAPPLEKKKNICSFNERFWKWVEQKIGLPAYLGSRHWFVLWAQICHAALPTGLCWKGRAVIPCLPSAGSEQLQPRGHRRLQAAGSQRALGGRDLHHHRRRRRHLLRGSLHNGEQGSHSPLCRLWGLPQPPLFIYLGMHMGFPKEFYRNLHFRKFCCLRLNTSDSVLAAGGFLETLAAPICFSNFGQLHFGISPPQLYHLSHRVTWDL